MDRCRGRTDWFIGGGAHVSDGCGRDGDPFTHGNLARLETRGGTENVVVKLSKWFFYGPDDPPLKDMSGLERVRFLTPQEIEPKSWQSDRGHWAVPAMVREVTPVVKRKPAPY
jgi:hypothetical protein